MTHHAPAVRDLPDPPALVRPSDGGASCHEVYAATGADAVAALGLALAMARAAAGDKPLLLVRDGATARETGALHGPGLAAFGLDPRRIILLEARDGLAALQGALEGARTPALGAVVVALFGEVRALDLTASRRLALAAERSGAPVLLVRAGAQPRPSAAESRFEARAAPSRALPANAPGPPAFAAILLRHRQGLAPQAWHLEWNRDAHRLDSRPVPLPSPLAAEPAADGARSPISGDVVSLPGDRQGAAAGHPAAGHREREGWRRAG